MLFSLNLQASTTWIPISVGDLTIIIPYVPDSIVYEDVEGNLYVKLPSSHGNKLLKLNKSLYWTSSDVTQVEWDELSLSISEYSISHGNFVGDSAQDLKITNNTVDVVVENSNGNYVVSQPADSPDDGSIGNIDADDNGIRDDIELEISQISPADTLKNGYLQHIAFYTRAFLLETTKEKKGRFLAEMMKGHACLLTTSQGEDDYATIVGSHLDSEDRFNRYIQNNNAVDINSLTPSATDCVLKGTGVEPISDCFYNHDLTNTRTFGGDGAKVTFPNRILGENVKINIHIINENYPGFGGSFRASYFLNGVLNDSQRLINVSDEYSWVIENYNFENDGYLKFVADQSDGIVQFTLTMTCEAN